jgi:hypothetical protein
VRADIVRAREPFYATTNPDTDTAACFDILQDWDFGFVHQVLTFTRRHNESRTSAIVRFEARRLHKLQRLLTYGPVYLDDQEYQARLGTLFENHYRALARSLFELREREFWDYQASELRQLGYPLSWPKLARAAAMELLDLRQSARRVQSGLARRRARHAAHRPAASQPESVRPDQRFTRHPGQSEEPS